MILKIRLTPDDFEKYSSSEFRLKAIEYLDALNNSLFSDSYYLPAFLREPYKQIRRELSEIAEQSRQLILYTDFDNKD